MSNALLSDVEARAQRRRTRTRDEAWIELVEDSWNRSKSATDPADARKWLERAHRMLPKDGMIAVSLAGALLRDGALAEAAALFQSLADQHGMPDAWAGLATCAHLRGQPGQAQSALAATLRSSVVTETIETLARAIAPPQGWCGLTADDALLAANPVRITVDGVPVKLKAHAGALRLPKTWRQASTLTVEGPDGPMLGSPLNLRLFAGVEGFVESVEGGITGWAWHPTDPGRAPALRASGPLGALDILAETPAENTQNARPLARPRHFALPAATVKTLGWPVAIRGPDGRHLLGSPLDPGLESRAAADPAHTGFAPIWAGILGPPPPLPPVRPGVDVVIPVYRGLRETIACLDSVLASIPRGTRVIVVDDASPDPDLVAALNALARRRRILLIRLPENRGFPGAANAGLKAAAGRDAVLLNSDTLTPPGWLTRLRAAAYSAPDIGTVTPLTNDGTIVSYPDAAGGNPAPNLAETIATDALAQAAQPGMTADLPVGVGFCLYVRRDCMDRVGLLREDLFAQGYGEENDLCLRARNAGWRSVAALDVFVAHLGATSFGPARAHLARRNGAILERLHPGYDAMVARHVDEDPLLPARRAMDALRWQAGRSRRARAAVILLTHGGGGGVDRVVNDRAAAARAAGQRAILLRPTRTGAVRISAIDEQPFPNLVFAMPQELPTLARLLREDRPTRVELHHTLGHHAAVADLPALLRAPQVSVLHDYARFCPRIALVSTERRYCGEPDLAGCEACVADLGSLLEDDPTVPDLLARSAAELSHATAVIAPSIDAATRLQRHFPAVRPVVEPWEDDRLLPPLTAAPKSAVRRVAVVGAIGVEKGFEVLLACVRDAKARRLPLEFTVVGFTADDERLMAAGPAFVTGEYKEDEAVALIQAQAAHLAFIPSVWPETWCFALSRAWQAGLGAAVFNLGAQAERVRATGRGWLLPLGLGPRAINDALLRLAPDALPEQCPPQFS